LGTAAWDCCAEEAIMAAQRNAAAKEVGRTVKKQGFTLEQKTRIFINSIVMPSVQTSGTVSANGLLGLF
jgi:hypothetical protein